MEIKLTEFSFGLCCFKLDTETVSYFTSESISKLLNLDTDLYNKLLIEKVIKHDDYKINDRRLFPSCTKHLSFQLNDIPKEIYIERFKEAFADQLILLTLE